MDHLIKIPVKEASLNVGGVRPYSFALNRKFFAYNRCIIAFALSPMQKILYSTPSGLFARMFLAAFLQIGIN
jgi:hypothetical protein